jgi:integrase
MPSIIVRRTPIAPGLEEVETATGRLSYRSTVYARDEQEQKTFSYGGKQNRTQARIDHKQHAVDFLGEDPDAENEGAELTVSDLLDKAYAYFETTVDLEDGYSQGSIDNYKAAKRLRIDGQPIAKITLAELKRRDALNWLRWLKTVKLSGFTKNGTVTALRTGLRYAREQEWMEFDPFAGIKSEEFPAQEVETEPIALSNEEGLRFEEAVRSDEFRAAGDTDYSNLILVARLEGLRISELLGRKVKDVEWGFETDGETGELVEVTKLQVYSQLKRGQVVTEPVSQKRLKNKKKGVRTIELFPESAAYITNQLEVEAAKGLGRPDDLLFTNADGTPICRHTVNRKVKRAAKIAGLDPALVMTKTLRTTLITGYAHAGVASVEIATKTGNSPAVIERNYVKPIRDGKQQKTNNAKLRATGFLGASA